MFCPNPVDWSVAATFAASIAALLNVVAIVWIAWRERRAREADRKEAVRAKAASMLADFNDAWSTIDAIGVYSNDWMTVDPELVGIAGYRDHFCRLRLSEYSANMDPGQMDGDSWALVMLSANALRRDQRSIRDLPANTVEEKHRLLDAVRRSIGQSALTLAATGDRLWQLTFPKGDATPPWKKAAEAATGKKPGTPAP